MLPLVMLSVAGSAFAGAVALAYVHAGWGVALVVLAFLVDAFSNVSVPLVTLGPIQVYFTDVAMVVVAAAMAFRLAQLAGRSRLPAALLALLGLAVVFSISFVRGVIEFGPQPPGVEFRRYLGFLAIGAYLVTFRPGRERFRAILWIWVAAAYVLCALTLYRWGLAVMAGEVGRLRVVGARETLMIAQAMLMCFHLVLVRDAGRFLRWSAAVFLPFVILLQHRTTWVLLLVAVVVMAAREGRLRARLAAALAFGGVAGTVGALVLYGDQSSEVLAESASQGSTFVWRLLGWRALLQEHVVDPVATLIGEPFGAGFVRFLPELGYTVDVTPHNFYVTVLLRGGLIALTCFAALYLLMLRDTGRAARLLPETHLGFRSAYVLILTQLVFFLSYDPHHEQGIVLGIALALASTAPESAPDPAAGSPPSRAAASPPGRADGGAGGGAAAGVGARAGLGDASPHASGPARHIATRSPSADGAGVAGQFGVDGVGGTKGERETGE